MPSPASKVLIVDDEPPIRKLLRVSLASEGFATSEATNGREAHALIRSEKPDLVLLDLGLPDANGHDLLAVWREDGIAVPVIVVSSRTDEAGIVRALDLGADDYVTKPFGTKELIARARVALRHKLQQQGERPIFRSGELSVDLVRRLVKLGDEEVRLSPKEYDILRVLVQHAGKVITHKQILKEVWGNQADPQYVRIYVRQLRAKLETAPSQPRYITTETGIGYRLRDDA